MDTDDIKIEDLLKEIYDNKLLIEKEKEEVSKNLNQVEMLRKKLEQDYNLSQEKAVLLVENAKIEAREILLNAQDEANEIIKKMNSVKSKNSIQDLYDLKNEINDKLKNYSISSSNKDGNLKLEDIVPGLNVYVIPLGKNGVIKELPNSSNEVLVEVGNIKTNININKLVKLNNAPKKENVITKSKNTNSFKSKTISNEINVIGLTVLEALPIIDKYLDDARLSKLEIVRIVHGKGTGKLKARNTRFFKKAPSCKKLPNGNLWRRRNGCNCCRNKMRKKGPGPFFPINFLPFEFLSMMPSLVLLSFLLHLLCNINFLYLFQIFRLLLLCYYKILFLVHIINYLDFQILLLLYLLLL